MGEFHDMPWGPKAFSADLNESCICRAKKVLKHGSQRSGGKARTPPATAIVEKASWASWTVVDKKLKIKCKRVEGVERDDKHERRKEEIKRQIVEGLPRAQPIKLRKGLDGEVIFLHNSTQEKQQ